MLLASSPILFADLFPSASSTSAAAVDQLFLFILAISSIFLLLILGMMSYFVVRYRSSRHRQAGSTKSHNLALEIAWTVVPAILVGVIFYRGFTTYLDSRTIPDNAYEVQVVAKKWSWAFIYENGHVDNQLHVPAGRPVALTMTSDDVIHSLYVPDFRVKMDLVPGRYSKLWFEVPEEGEHVLFCAEYCGTGHSTMDSRVIVHEPNDFERWLDSAGKFMEELSPAEAGKVLYARRGCVQCHSVDGSAKAGPSFSSVFGTEQRMADGEILTVDENYIRESILNPLAKVRDGYRPVMPTYQGQLDDEEIAAIIQYIKSLKID